MVRRFFLAWCVLTSCVVSGQPTYVLQGQTFQLRPEIPGQPDEILWKHNGNKVVEFNGKEEDVYGKYQRRVILDWVTAELDITDVTSEDSGEYELEAYREKHLYHFRSELQVIDRVAKPTISCNMSNGSSNTHGTQATLTCSAEPTHPRSVLKYEWQSRGNVLPGPKLTINLEDEDADQIHTCVVSNPLTNEKATFTSKSCYSDSPVALVASLVTIFIVLVCVVLAIVYCKLKRKACFAKQNKDEEQRSPAESKYLLDQASTLPSHQPLDRFQGDGNMEAGVISHNKDKDNGHRHGEGHDTDLQDEKPKKGHVKRFIDKFTPKSYGQSSPPDTQRGLGLEKNTDQDEGAVSSPSPLGIKPDQDSSISKDKADVNEDQLGRHLGNEMEPDPAGELDITKDTQSDVEPFLEQPACCAKQNKDEEQKSPAESKPLLDQASTLPSHQPLDRFQGDGNMEAGVTSHSKDKDNGHRHGEDHNTDLQDETPKKGHVKRFIDKFTPKSNGQSSPPDTQRDLKKNTDQDDNVKQLIGMFIPESNGQSSPPDTQRGNEMEPDPAGELDITKDTQSDVEPFLEQPESKPLLDQASTLPSHQPLERLQGDGNMEAGVTSHNKDKDNGHRHGEDHNTDFQDETPKKGHVKQQVDKFTPKSNGQSSPPDTQRGLEKNTDQDEGAVSSPSPLGIKPDQDSSISKDKADVNEDQLRRHLGNEMEPNPAESEKKEDENEEAESPPAKGNSPPTADKCPPLTQSSPDMRTREGANSDQVTDETSEENVRESHSTGSVKKQPSSRGSETALHAQDPNLSQDEMHTSKDDQGDLDKALSKDESESDHKSNPKVEEMDSEEDLYLDASQQPHQSPTQTEPDDSKTLNNEAHADPEQGPENMRRPKSEESEEQSACDTADLEKGEDEGEGEGEDTAEKNKKDQCGPKEEKTGSLNMSEDEEREMKTEIDD